MSKRVFKYFLKLSPEQMQRVAEECAPIGPYRLVQVKRTRKTLKVTVRFENGTQKTVIV